MLIRKEPGTHHPLNKGGTTHSWYVHPAPSSSPPDATHPPCHWLMSILLGIALTPPISALSNARSATVTGPPLLASSSRRHNSSQRSHEPGHPPYPGTYLKSAMPYPTPIRTTNHHPGLHPWPNLGRRTFHIPTELRQAIILTDSTPKLGQDHSRRVPADAEPTCEHRQDHQSISEVQAE